MVRVRYCRLATSILFGGNVNDRVEVSADFLLQLQRIERQRVINRLAETTEYSREELEHKAGRNV